MTLYNAKSMEEILQLEEKLRQLNTLNQSNVQMYRDLKQKYQKILGKVPHEPDPDLEYVDQCLCGGSITGHPINEAPQALAPSESQHMETLPPLTNGFHYFTPCPLDLKYCGECGRTREKHPVSVDEVMEKAKAAEEEASKLTVFGENSSFNYTTTPGTRIIIKVPTDNKTRVAEYNLSVPQAAELLRRLTEIRDKLV